MNEEGDPKPNGFLRANQLRQIKGIGSMVWEDLQQSELTLPKTGRKYFEPNGSWLQEMQLENGLKNRKKVIEMERVDRAGQLAAAEWLPGTQKARVTKRSGQKWESFGYEDHGSQLYLLPEEALILLEMNCLELNWNGVPLSIQQAYEVLINSENSKCTLDEYRVYSQLIRCGYRLQRYYDKSFSDSKLTNTAKRIIMNPDGLWTPNTSPPLNSNDSSNTSKTFSEQSDIVPDIKIENTDSDKAPKPQRIGIVSEETVLGNIKIVKNNVPTTKENDSSNNSANQVSKWPGSRIQRNVKLMPKRNDKVSNTNVDTVQSSDNVPAKRKNSNSTESPSKKPRPEIIELSDDEIEEIPRPMTRMEIINTFPNLAPNNESEPVIVEIPRTHIPHNIRPVKEFYRFDRSRLFNLSQNDNMLKTNMQIVPINNGQSSHFYSQPDNECQAVTTYNSNNGYSYRGMRCQRQGGSYIQQNISHNAIHSPYSATVVQSNYVNFVMEVMGNMVRSFRQQQFQQTTYCQNLQVFTPRFPFSQRYQPYNMNCYQQYPARDQYCRKSSGGLSTTSMPQRGKGYTHYSNNSLTKSNVEEPSQPSFTKRAGVESWSELKKKWREESTITIEDEEPVQMENLQADNSEVQVVEESISPLINTKGISNLSKVYEKLRIIKSASERTIRSRRVDYSFSYEVFPAKQNFKKSEPGTPMCRLYIVNSKKEAFLDPSKLQRLQQDSKDVPVVVAFVSQSCISYIQPGTVVLPNLS